MKKRFRKKRLRKKYHLGEFKVHCFDFSFHYNGAPFSPEEDKFYDAFILDCIEGNGLNCGGGSSPDGLWEFTAHSVDKSKRIEDQREDVKRWLEARDDVQFHGYSELKDAYYDYDY